MQTYEPFGSIKDANIVDSCGGQGKFVVFALLLLHRCLAELGLGVPRGDEVINTCVF